ncbi:hypothetical protein A0U93_11025 [Neoasaia chiangmaiensis]|uniref:NAD-dependent epimerase/dehydratase domain-containing protein n=2 Tax=Neoasaia chiangmaiensis TaxID=320497 RepID=A0A1U9KUN2_9PROT|nr:hypothetical protein A0U93_11025 [Neoasaia chiangmaiensis]
MSEGTGMTKRIATVIGGHGFIGRHVVEGLVAEGYTVRVTSRRPDRIRRLRRLGGGNKVIPVYASVTDATTLHAAIDGAEGVVNLVSILTESAQATFHAINGQAAGRVARIAAEHDVARYVHVSAIGADPQSPSAYGRSKAEGEAAVRRIFPHAGIIRPSVVFGPEDRFLNMFATMARFLPVMPVFCGDTRFQPVYVGDVAAAIVTLLDEPQVSARLVEAGGPDILTMREVMRYVMTQTGHQRPLLTVPLPLARLEASLFERLPGKLLTNDQINMMQKDNVVASEAVTLGELGIEPTPMSKIVPQYLHRSAR